MRLILLVFLASIPACSSQPLRLEVGSPHLPANGVATREVRASGSRGPVDFEIVQGRSLIDLLGRGPNVVTLRAGLTPGRVTIRSTDGSSSAEIVLTLHADPADEDRDGFPDAAELPSSDERTRFRSRFVAVARSQRRGIDPRWPEEQHDCAGLVRFAYRQALRSTPSPLSYSLNEFLGPPGWGKLRFSFPDIPFLIDRPFRLEPGAFEGTTGAFGPFADAKHLLIHNTIPLGKQETRTEAGDLLFYFHPENADQPYHMMIYFLRGREGWVVYHTGASADETGRLKEIPLSRLGEHPDPSWHPRSTNENFLGYYRFKILG